MNINLFSLYYLRSENTASFFVILTSCNFWEKLLSVVYRMKHKLSFYSNTHTYCFPYIDQCVVQCHRIKTKTQIDSAFFFYQRNIVPLIHLRVFISLFIELGQCTFINTDALSISVNVPDLAQLLNFSRSPKAGF